MESSWDVCHRPGAAKVTIPKRQASFHGKRPLTSAEDLLAGSASGAIAAVIGHPFDTVKVRLQAGPSETVSSVLRQFRTGRGVLRSAYKGLGPPLASVPFANGVVCRPGREPSSVAASASRQLRVTQCHVETLWTQPWPMPCCRESRFFEHRGL